MPPLRPSRLLTLALLAASCAPEGQLPLAVVALGEADGALSLEVRPVGTLTHLSSLQGEAASLRVGARVNLDPVAIQEAIFRGEVVDDQSLRAFILKDEGAPPAARFDLSELEGWGPAYLGADLHAFSMASAYAAVEGARARAISWGLRPACHAPLPIYYDLHYVDHSVSPHPLIDDAAYFDLLGGLMILPFSPGETLPAALNPGVLSHEYAHALWDCLLNKLQGTQAVDRALDPASDFLLRALNEGLADFVGAGVVGRPRYLASSYPELRERRDVSTRRALSPELLPGHPDFVADPYALGAVYAAALWELSEGAGVDPVGAGMLRGLDQLRARLPGKIEQAAPLDATTLASWVLLGLRADLALDRPACEIFERAFPGAGEAAGCAL